MRLLHKNKDHTNMVDSMRGAELTGKATGQLHIETSFRSIRQHKSYRPDVYPY